MTQFAHDAVVPDQESGMKKKEQVARMFNSIAGRYDFMNRFLTAGVDVRWRRKAISQLAAIKPRQVLDVATGTGDVAIMTWQMLHPEKIIGIDISDGMLELGRQKIEKLQLSGHIQLQHGDSEQLPFETAQFDAVTVSFGVRNFEDLEKGLSEMLRVLRPGGRLVVLEFSKPRQPFKALSDLYMNVITPAVGRLFANNRQAYQYLTDSVEAFPEGNEFLSILNRTGYTDVYLKRLSLGICTIYCGSRAS